MYIKKNLRNYEKKTKVRVAITTHLRYGESIQGRKEKNRAHNQDIRYATKATNAFDNLQNPKKEPVPLLCRAWTSRL